MSKYKILSTYDLEDQSKSNSYSPSEIAWAGILDKKYVIEIQRLSPYKGILLIFNGISKELLSSEEVYISYDAIFGPNMYDVNEWQHKAEKIIDKWEKTKN